MGQGIQPPPPHRDSDDISAPFPDYAPGAEPGGFLHIVDTLTGSAPSGLWTAPTAATSRHAGLSQDAAPPSDAGLAPDDAPQIGVRPTDGRGSRADGDNPDDELDGASGVPEDDAPPTHLDTYNYEYGVPVIPEDSGLPASAALGHNGPSADHIESAFDDSYNNKLATMASTPSPPSRSPPRWTRSCPLRGAPRAT